MTAYLILGVCIFYFVSTIVSFFTGYAKGRAKEKEKQKDEALRRAESDKAFEAKEEKIEKEVYQNAETKKAELPRNSGRDSFDAINNSLRDKN